MLVLERKLNESIRIGDDIIITVVGKIKNERKVRLGITAPPETSIYREEDYDKRCKDATGRTE
jgi:carbon storage regulator